MSFLDKFARIRAELLGAASDMPAAQVVAAAAAAHMGIVPEPSWALEHGRRDHCDDDWRRRQHVTSSSGEEVFACFAGLFIDL